MLAKISDFIRDIIDVPPQEDNVFGKKLTDPNAITAAMNKMRQERMENIRDRKGVVHHPDGRVEQYHEVCMERGSMTEVQSNGHGDFQSAAKAFVVSTVPVPTLLPHKRHDLSELEANLVEIQRLLRKP